MNRLAVGALAEIAGATGSIAIAAVAVYVGIRQWVDGKRISREQRELTEEIERKSEAAKLEQDRIIRAQSLDSYFDGISTLLLLDEDGIFTDTARSLTKGRTDAILKILKADEKRNLIAFLYGSGLISSNGDGEPAMVALSGSDLSEVELNGTALPNAGFGMANLRGASIKEADLDGVDLRRRRPERGRPERGGPERGGPDRFRPEPGQSPRSHRPRCDIKRRRPSWR